MGRDVEYNLTANDKVGTGIASAERKLAASQEKARRDSKKTGDTIGDNLTKGVGKAGPAIADRITSALGLGGNAGGIALAAGIAAASPVIGGLLSAAVIGGAGIGGVLGGVALAARDPRVKAAGTALGKNLLESATKDASAFIDPVLRNIDKAEARFGQMNTRLTRIFDTSSGFLDPLVNGALDAVDGILRGVDALVAKGKPVIAAFGQSFTIIGDSVGDALEIIAGGADESASALLNTAKAIGAVVEATAYLIRGLTEVYGVVSFLPGKISDVGQKLGSLVGVGDQAGKTVAGVGTNTAAAALQAGRFAPLLATVTKEAVSLDARAASAANAVLQLANAELAAANAVAGFNAGLKENGRTHDLTTQKGRANQANLLALVSSYKANHDSVAALNGEGRKSAEVSTKQAAAFQAQAVKIGYTKSQAAALARQYGLVPTRIETAITANTKQAEERTRTVRSLLDQVRSKTISVNVLVNESKLNKVNNTLNRLGGAGLLAAAGSFALTGPGATARTGGPDPVNVTAAVSSSLYLDGSLIYERTDRQVQARSQRDAWRQKVGLR